MIILEKQISKFDISRDIARGKTKQLIICPKCNYKNIITCIHKFRYIKKKAINCIKCNQSILVGDIFNFKTGTHLNNRNEVHNQQTLDDFIWDKNYDKL